jgi:hypothetical protein
MIIPLLPIFSANSMYAEGQPKSKDLALINPIYHDLAAPVSHWYALELRRSQWPL